MVSIPGDDEEALGRMAAAARALGVSATTVRRYALQDPHR
jgi:hypothetical protein